MPLVLLDDEPVELGDDELEPLELGLELLDVLLSVELELEPDVDGEVADGAELDGAELDGGSVLDGGDADGVRSPGFSPTRSVRLSLQAVSRPALSATAMTAVSILFISMPPP